MDEGVLDEPIRAKTRLQNQALELFPQLGLPQTRAGLEHKGEGELVGSNWALVEHGEEKEEGTGGIGGFGISTNEGVVEVGINGLRW